jgi:tripartite-type tricarboxylate transporter receptor subunit TctC
VQWYGIVGPARMPAEVTKRLNAEINKAITSPALQQRLASEALTAMPMAPEQFGKFIQDEIAKYTVLAKERNIRLDD